MKQLVFVLGVVVALSACSKDKDKGGSGGGGGGGGAAASNKPLEMTAPELFADYTSDKYDGLKLLDRYRPGVKVTGKVKQTIGGGENKDMNYNIWLDADAGKWIDLQFMPDDPNFAAATAKGVKTGDQVTAQCEVLGSDPDKYVMLGKCTLL